MGDANMQTIGLRYTLDGGTTWLPSTGARSFLALKVHTFLRAEEQDSSDELMDEDNICTDVKARMYVVVELDTKQFNTGRDTSAVSNYQYINKLRCAPVINLHLDNTTPFEFNTMFNYSTGTTYNTNYLLPEDIPDIDYQISGDVKKINFTFKMKKSFDIST